MSISQTRENILALAIAKSTSWERMEYFLPLMRLLVNGEPISRAHLATALGRPVEEVTGALRQFEDVVFDEEGRMVGAGLSLLPTPYRFEVQGRALFTWCALDTLIFPAWLEQTAQVSAACPVTGTAIRLTVTKDRVEQFDPASSVISLRVAEELATCCTIRDAFCAYSQFFASREAASAWHAQHPDGSVLSIQEAFALGQTLTRLTMQQVQERCG